MKRKGITVLLVLIVGCIWAAVLSKVIPGSDTTVVVDPAPSRPATTAPMPSPLPAEDSLGHFADPFLRRRSPHRRAAVAQARPQTAPAPSVVAVKTPATGPPVNRAWPTIRYNGILKSAAGERTVAILDVSGRTLMLRTGQEDMGLHIVVLASDSVVLTFAGEQRTFRR